MKNLTPQKESHVEYASPTRHDELDHLAGTWSEEDAVAFKLSTAGFDEIDASLWKGDKQASLH